MLITVNGEEKNVEEGTSLQEIIALLNIEDKVMAAAINMEIVKKDQWTTFKPQNNDKLELLQFVGGG